MTWPENQEDNEEEDWMMNWDRRRRTAAVQVVCSVVYALKLHQVYYSTKHHINKSPTNLKGKKRNAPRDDLCRREFESIKAAINSVAEAIREGNTIAKRGQARVYSEEEVFAELVNLGIDKRLRYRGYTFLTQNASRVRAFFGCPVEERKNFLLQLMYGPHNL